MFEYSYVYQSLQNLDQSQNEKAGNFTFYGLFTNF